VTPPLLAAFEALRPRLGLGFAEYRDLLAALGSGFAAGSREDLVAVCQLLWAKTPDDARLVAAVVAEHLPRRLTEGEAEELTRNRDGAREPPPEEKPPGLRDPARDRAAPAPDGGLVQAGQVVDGPAGAAQLRPPVAPALLAEPWRFNLTGDAPRLAREFLREWRAYRRMLAAGPGAEVDVPATIDRLLRDGALAAPAFARDRRNRVSLLLLVDQSRSMTPSRWRVATLVTAVRRAGYARVAVHYFDNAPDDPFALDPGLTRFVALDEVMKASAPNTVVVVGDAGAARGGRDELRAARTIRTVEVLRDRVGRVGWVNPTPEDRWAGTTAALIRDRGRVPMVELSGAGLRRLVVQLRGSEPR
jgi:uncharacterized protein with von Willebrand factor type A (vWA) domain